MRYSFLRGGWGGLKPTIEENLKFRRYSISRNNERLASTILLLQKELYPDCCALIFRIWVKGLDFPVWTTQGQVCINNLTISCRFCLEEGDETQWTVKEALKLVFRTRDDKKRIEKYQQHLKQVTVLYKQIWGVESDPPILPIKFGPSAKPREPDTRADDDEIHVKRLMTPTCLLVTFLVWGMMRRRRQFEDVKLASDSLSSLWHLCFATLQTHKFRIQRMDDQIRSFHASRDGTSYVRCIVCPDEIATFTEAWEAMHRESRPHWMTASDPNEATLLQILLFLLWPSPPCSDIQQYMQPVTFQLLQQFSRMVNKTGKLFGDRDAVAVADIFKNRAIVFQQEERRKQLCAEFLLKVCDSRLCILEPFFCLIKSYLHLFASSKTQSNPLKWNSCIE